MGFTVENKPKSIVKFIFSDNFSSSDMKEILGLLTILLDLKKPFAFYVDTRNASKIPVNSAPTLISWMKKNKYRFRELLMCSAVVVNNTMTNNMVSKFLEGVFFIQPTVSPNMITNNLEKGEKWVEEQVDKFNTKHNTKI